ncbi:uncharacterized protein TRAVEDRAFT_55069 [Trametes versicolor FP-101664 SS1]|uniref:uncharacterized protein n=1 Tax=Trametes versicolor (strain FP-101664) TaxID=717944 RepID=UPI00046232F6|nr:uncharacterized protein TRAVEDRAFT_55069 [Trametes versicolor FP-101664 SS1]EIW64015.1 hypothetical protein TRAVEDRAFT_55069 [Trametes versicolor FP-101664 SS1]
MLSQLSLVAALALAPWSSALLLATPVDWHSSSVVNISWSSVASDPPFSFELVNTDAFHDTFALANNVNPTLNFLSFELGVVPVGTYTLEAINVTNNAQIFDQTPSFSIGAAPASTSSSASSTVSSAASSSGSASASATGSGSNTLTVPAASSTSGGFGTTVSNTASASASGSGSAAGSSSSAAPTSFNNGAASLPRLATWAIGALGVVAGAAALL